MPHNHRKKNTQALYRAVREDYAQLSKQDDKYGCRKFTDAYIFKILSARYFRSPKTIENIVFYRV
ncbi:hypothetical protein EI546_06485 [Aequorivita sp. H23M31]|uniref:Transposase n=1 Tax=Aequorivita ciconiae TaxID=2494375 RepID=A0A410G2A4_9FLAO|nr:hypothetical protein [Aequorivita sp. H23M31]QAA81396.1 hypothetical protein EI546_06485 [Aequorivita sp. H23M31]